MTDLSAEATLARAKDRAAQMAYEAWEYREGHPRRAPQSEMHRGQGNTAMSLLRCLCNNDHAEIVRVCDPYEIAFRGRNGTC